MISGLMSVLVRSALFLVGGLLVFVLVSKFKRF